MLSAAGMSAHLKIHSEEAASTKTRAAARNRGQSTLD